MADEHTTDERVLGTIKQLVDEEHTLWEKDELDDQARARLQSIRVALDQCWDLLRQRRARREFGDDPDKAQVRPPNIVENYEQ
jgi:non-homologous end joining protein Ku